MNELDILCVKTNMMIEIEGRFISDKELAYEVQNAAIILAP